MGRGAAERSHGTEALVSGQVSAQVSAALGPQRADKWLFHARFFKTRALAARLLQAGKVRLTTADAAGNERTERLAKAHANVRAGDVLTFPQGARVRVVRILACAERRGPAKEAQALYLDLAAGQADMKTAPEDPIRDPAAPPFDPATDDPEELSPDRSSRSRSG